MSLLFDQNLSWRLPVRSAAEYPGCRHVKSVGLLNADDRVVWAHAAAEGLAVVSKDRDLVDLAIAHGLPPKVIWLKIGNCSTRDMEALMRVRLSEVTAFLADPRLAILELP